MATMPAILLDRRDQRRGERARRARTDLAARIEPRVDAIGNNKPRLPQIAIGERTDEGFGVPPHGKRELVPPFPSWR